MWRRWHTFQRNVPQRSRWRPDCIGRSWATVRFVRCIVDFTYWYVRWGTVITKGKRDIANWFKYHVCYLTSKWYAGYLHYSDKVGQWIVKRHQNPQTSYQHRDDLRRSVACESASSKGRIGLSAKSLTRHYNTNLLETVSVILSWKFEIHGLRFMANFCSGMCFKSSFNDNHSVQTFFKFERLLFVCCSRQDCFAGFVSMIGNLNMVTTKLVFVFKLMETALWREEVLCPKLLCVLITWWRTRCFSTSMETCNLWHDYFGHFPPGTYNIL